MQPDQMEKIIRDLQSRVAALESGSKAQLTFPLDVASVGVLTNALASNRMDDIKTNKLSLSIGASDEPDKEGQIVYKKSTQTLKVKLGGTVRTITTS